MSNQQLDQERERLIALSGAQRIQLKADIQHLGKAVRERVRTPLQAFKGAVPVAIGAVVLAVLFRRRGASGLPAGSSRNRWQRLLELAMRFGRIGLLARLWPWVRLWLLRPTRMRRM